MKSTVEQLSPTRVKLTVEVPFEELTPDFERAYKSLAQQVNIPGFRKGKAPAKLLEARIGRGPVLDQVVNDMLPSRYDAAVTENNLRPLGQPEVEITKLEDGELVEFTAEVDVRPEITLPDLSSLEVEVEALSTDDDAVDSELDNLRARFGSLKGVERAAAKEDFVSIDLSATVDGEVVEDASTTGLSHQVGQDNLIEGLDDAIEGLKAGESATFTSKLLAGEHAGDEAEVTVTVNKVQERELPELDDDFAEMASEFDTLDELRADLAEKAKEKAKVGQATQVRDAVLAKLLEVTEIPIPERVVEAEAKASIDQVTQQFGGDEETLKTILESQGMDREKFEADARETAEKNVRNQLLLDAIAEEREVEIGQEELMEHIFFQAQQYNMDPNTFVQQLQASGQIGQLFSDVRRGKALASVITEVSVKDTEGNAVDTEEYFGDSAAEDGAEGDAEGDSAEAVESSEAAGSAETVDAEK